MPPRLGLRPASFVPAQYPPVALANGPYSALVGGTVLLDRGGSGDRYGTYQVYWTPGDGRAELGPYAGAVGDISVQYDTVGTYWATLRVVSDTTGLQALATAVVSVLSVAAVASVVVDPTTMGGIVGDVFAVTATAYDSGGQPLLGRTITWGTDTPSVTGLSATVGAAIFVTLLAAGTATVTATCEGQTADVAVTATAVVAVGSVVVTPASVTGLAGDVVTLTARVYAGGAPTVDVSRFYYSLTKVPLGTPPAFAASWKTVTGDWPAKFPATLEAVAADITGLGTQPDGWYGQSESSNWASTDATGILQFVSPPLAGSGTLAGTVKGRIRSRQSSTSSNMNPACLIRVISGDGATVRGTALALTAGSATNDANPESAVAADNTGAANRECPYGAGSAVALSSTAYQDGDRILVELGMRFCVTNSLRVGYLVTTTLGASDLPEDTTTGTDLRPWIEFPLLTYYA